MPSDFDFKAFFAAASQTTPSDPIVYCERAGSREQLINATGAAITQHLLEARSVLKRSKHKVLEALLESVLAQSDAITTRSGDLGEILATEYVRANTSFSVPINKLQWKSDRKMPMHGNDLVGINTSGKKSKFLKGETKSQQVLTATTVKKASSSLDLNGGRPNPSTVAFVIQRLFASNRDAEALEFADALADGLIPSRIHHQIFVLTGEDPTDQLKATPKPIRKGITRSTAAVVVNKHQSFIRAAYKSAHGK